MFEQEQQIIEDKVKAYCAANDIQVAELKLLASARSPRLCPLNRVKPFLKDVCGARLEVPFFPHP